MLKPKIKTTLSMNLARLVSSWFKVVLFVVALTGVFLYTRVGAPSRVQAATSDGLNFQARLLDNGGGIVADGTYNVEFKLYDSLAAGASAQGVCVGGGTDDCLWVETRSGANKVTVKAGYLSVHLGDVTAFPAINWDQNLYLTMNIGGTGAPSYDGEMAPRLKLTAVPYAFAAGQLAKYNGTQTGTLKFNTVANSPDILLPDIAGTNNVLLQSGTTLFTQGSIPFTDSTGRQSQDNANYFWDDTNNRLGIGTATPSATLSVGSGGTTNFTVTGATGTINTNGGYVQSGVVANTLTGVTTLSASGTALVVTNDATIGGTLGVSGLATFNAGLTVINGQQLTNAGSTLLTAVAISDLPTGGAIGTAAATVNSATTFNVNQTTSGQTLTLPSPTVTTAGRIAFVTNIGSTPFAMHGVTVTNAKAQSYVWNGSAWVGTNIDGAGSGATSVGTLDGAAKSADGASISANLLYLQTADDTYPGLVSTGVQTLAGAKTFSAQITAGAGVDLATQTLQGTTAVINFSNFDVDASGNVITAGDLAVNGGDITSSGALNITPGGALVVGATGQTATLQGSTTTITSTGTLNVGANATAQTITLGNVTGATALNLYAGTGNFVLDGVAGTTYALGASTTTGTVTIGGTAQTGAITIGSSSGTNSVLVGNGAGATTVDIANANTAGAVNIGSAFTTGTVSIGGTGAQTGTISLGTGTGVQTINLGTGGTGAKTVTLGSTASTGVTAIQAGGNIVLNSSAGTIELQDNTNITGNLDVSGTLSAGTGDAFQVSAGGAVTAVGVNSGTGLLQGTGGLTLTGTTLINTTGSGTTQIGNATGTLQIDSDTIDISTAGAVTGVTGLTMASGNFLQSGAGSFGTGSGGVSLNGATTVTGSNTFTSGTGTVLLQGATDVAATVSLATKAGATYTTASSANDVAISTASLYRLDTSGAAQTITGIAAGRDGQYLTLVSADATLAFTLNNLDGASAAANQISTGTGTNLSVPAGSSVNLIYDATSSLWRVIGAAGVTGGFANQQLSNLSGTIAINASLTPNGDNTLDLGSSSFSWRTLYADTSVLTPSVDVASAGPLAIGNATATSVSICNSTDCDAITIGTNADADTISVGDALDTVNVLGAVNINTTGTVTTTIGNSGATVCIGGGFCLINTSGTTIDIGSTSAYTTNIGANNGSATNIGIAGATVGILGTLGINNSGTSATSIGNTTGATTILGATAINDTGSNALSIGSTSAGALSLQGSISIDSSGNTESLGTYSSPYGGFGTYANLLTRSELFAHAEWVSTNLTPTNNNTTAPNGIATASRLVSTASGTHTAVQDFTSVTSTAGDYTTSAGNNTYTFSVWLKGSVGTESVSLRIDSNGTPATGTASTFTATTAWKRYSVTQTFTSGVTTVSPTVVMNDNSATLYAWGAQLEESSKAGVYVHTSAAGIASATKRGLVSNGGAYILTESASSVGLVVQGTSSQTGDLLQIQNTASTNYFAVSSSGLVTIDSTITTRPSNSSGGGPLTVQPGTVNAVSGVGAILYLNGGSESGATSTGGSVIIDAGTGTSSKGAISIGTTNATSITLGNSTDNTALTLDSGTGTIAIGTGAQARTVNFATGAAAQAVTIGSTNSTSALTLQAGTGTLGIGNDAVAKTTTIAIGSNSTGADLVSVGSAHASSTIILESGTAATAIQIGNGATAHGIQIGTGAAVQTIVVGSTNSSSALTLQAGTGGIILSGSTVATTLALTNFAAGGSIGTAATTVDLYSGISVAQTTASQTLTIPTPTASGTYGRRLSISNIGTTSFTILGSIILPGNTGNFVWSNTNGAASWQYAGDGGGSANYIQNQNTAAQATSNFWISGTGTAATKLLTPSLDVLSGGSTLSLGATNATALAVGNATMTGNIALQSGLGATTITNTAPASAAGNGTAASSVLTVTGSAGGATSGTTAQTAGAGSAITLTLGAGGAATGASGANIGGAGGAFTLQGGAGGAISSTAAGATGGAGGALSFTAGNGAGNNGANAGQSAGAGGAITLQAGTGGATGTAASSGGAGGQVLINGGVGNYLSVGGIVRLTGGSNNSTANTGGVITAAGSGYFNAGSVSLTGGNVVLGSVGFANSGGSINLTGGNATADGTVSSNGGGVNITAGNATTTTAIASNGGSLVLTAGNAVGSSGTRTGGSVTIDTGTGASTNGSISIGTTNAVAITIGNSTSATAVNIVSGSGNVNLGSTTLGLQITSDGVISDIDDAAVNINDDLDVAGTLTVGTANATNLSLLGVLTLAGSQSPADITTTTAATATNITVQPGISSAATGNGANTFILGGNQSGTTTSAGGYVSIQGGAATGASGSRTGGAVVINGGTGADSNGQVGIATLVTGTVVIGNGSSTLSLQTSNIDISSTGVISGATGLTVAGTTDINATGTAATTIGNSGAGVLALQGSAVGVTSNGAGNDITLTSADDILFQTGGATTRAILDDTSLTFQQITTIGMAASAGTGYALTIQSGNAAGTNNGGNLALVSGNGSGVASGGNISLTAGNAPYMGGNVSILAGNGASGGTGVAGNITIDTGTGLAGASKGTISIGTTNATSVTLGNSTDNTAITLASGTGIINIGAAAQARTINIGTGAAVVQTISIGGTGANVISLGSTQTAGSIDLGASMTTGTINLGGTGLQTGTITLGGGTGAQIVNLATGGTGIKTINLGGTAANVIAIGNTQTAGSISLGAAMTTGTISIGGTGAQTGTISIATGTGVQTVDVGTGGTGAKTVNIGSTASTSSVTINTGSGVLGLNTATARFTEITGTRTLTVETRTTNVAGTSLTVSAGAAGIGASPFTGGLLSLLGGAAGGTGNANGGNVALSGGAGTGTGVKGLVVIDTPTYATATVQNFTGNAAITQANVDANGAILISSNAAGYTATMGDPTITTAGRIIYVTNSGSFDMTLSVNGGGSGNTITLKPNTSATMIWNGSDWTAAGASSSTDLQAAYNNTATSAGGAELVLNASGGAADGLTIRNNDITPISGGILEVQSSIGTNLFSVSNLGTELAANGGSETSSTWATNWTAAPGGGSPVRTTTVGEYVTGQAAVEVVTAGTSDGVKNNLSGSPVISTTYQVSFTAKLSAGTFTGLEVVYSDDGTDEDACTAYSTQTLSTSVWTKITCTITTDAGGVSGSGPDLIIRQPSGDATARTFWIDNLSFMQNDATTQPSNVQIGGGINGGPITLFTLDRASAPPVADGDTTFLGSMYYDTLTGRIQCYESDGWGACGSAPDNIITLTPEYSGAVLNGSGVGTMTADFCSNETAVLVVGTLCANHEVRNFYRWTSPQASAQTYSIYVSYKLPSTFREFNSSSTMKLTALTTDTTLANATFQVFRKNVVGNVITSCGAATTINASNDTWEQTSFSSDETACGFTGSDYIVFKINVTAEDNENIYIENLDFTYSNR